MSGATIRDVARLAGVSVASVSRALNGLNTVAPGTRTRVEEAATRLGYAPHAGARSLSLARAHALGVVLPDLHGEFFSEVVRGMDREASARGYMLFLSNMHNVAGEPAAMLRAMRGRVDGLLVMAPHIAPDALAEALPTAMPSLLINSSAAITGRPAIRFDNAAGARAIVAHLAAGGARRIVHLRGPEGNLDAEERVAGYRAAMAALLPDVTPTVLAGDFSAEGGVAAARAILDGGADGHCDALFAANDMMAIGFMEAMKAAGREVPGDVAIAGFDDVPLARYLRLTTARVRISEIGARAVARLIDVIEGNPDERTEMSVPELVVRTTTKPA